MKTVDPVLEYDLDAYVDDQLDLTRRIEVEAYLSQNPLIAAKVMADLRLKGELRLALAGPVSHGRQETREAARRLQGALSRGRLVGVFQRAAVVAIFAAGGWMANTYINPFRATEVVASVPPPAFIEEAVRAHATLKLREQMPSQREVRHYDPGEIRSVTGIIMPAIPNEWQVMDVQIFPSAYGPSVELSISPGEGKQLSLFAVRPGTFNVQQVLSHVSGEVQASYWQIGEVAYALVSNNPDMQELKADAISLASTLY